MSPPPAVPFARYTRLVTWRHHIAIGVLALLAGLPVVGAVCAVACEPASLTAASHHGAGQKCEMAAHPSAGSRMRGVSAHDCGTHDADARLIRTTAAKRADAAAKAPPAAAGTAHRAFITLPALEAPLPAHTGPPGAPSPTTTSVVLRV